MRVSSLESHLYKVEIIKVQAMNLMGLQDSQGFLMSITLQLFESVQSGNLIHESVVLSQHIDIVSVITPKNVYTVVGFIKTM